MEKGKEKAGSSTSGHGRGGRTLEETIQPDVLGRDWRPLLDTILPVTPQREGCSWASAVLSMLTAHYAITNPHKDPPQFSFDEIIALKDKDPLRVLYPQHYYEVNRALLMVAKYGLKIRPSDPSPTKFIPGCTVIAGNQEDSIMYVLENHGPVIAVLNMPVDLYFNEKTDILGLHGCDMSLEVLDLLRAENQEDQFDRCVLFVSSGTNSKGENFWIARNYWGEGEDSQDDQGYRYLKVGRPSSLRQFGKTRNPTKRVCFPYLRRL